MKAGYPTVTPLRATASMPDSASWWRRVDPILVSCVLVCAGLGLLMIFSATRNLGEGASYTGYVFRQALWLGAGVLAMVGISLFDYRKLQSMAPIIYGATTAVLFLVLTPLGSTRKGAQAWFGVGAFQIQPAEFAKLSVIIAVSAYCARHSARLTDKFVGVAVGLAAIPVGLILLQPDLGTTLVFCAVVFAIILAAGASGRSLAILVGLVIFSAVAVVQLGILKQYQLDRLGAFLDPASNTQQAAYNLNQSKIAIGSGELLGRGLFSGSQTNLRFVPEQHTDFIFTVVGEELGLAGSVTLLALLGVVLWRIWRVARAANDSFGAFICIGVLGMLAFQIFENVGMAMGIMPITGIPLPFVSYGGSSLLATFMAIGLVQSVRLRTR